VPVRPEYIADANANIGARISPPVLNIPGPNGNAPGDKAQPRTKTEYGGINFFEFTLSDLDGRPTRLADIRGRLTLIDIWNTDSITCQQALPELMKLHKQFCQQGLVVVGIAANEQGTATAKADKIRWRGNKQGVEFSLLMEANDSVKQAFKAEQFTTLILLDDAGREVWRHTGFNPDVKAQLEREIVSRLR
jgi:peroxiredoxin